MKHRWLVRTVLAGLVVGGTVGYIATRPGYALPNRTTPGTIMSDDPTIVCRAGYTSTIRVSLSPAQERQVDRAYGWTYGRGKQEYDHLIPLELGGANGVANIWPEPIAQARIKDRLENRLHARACRTYTVDALRAAQACIRVDWVACWKREGSP